jgi:hypothetical protein
MTDRPGSAYRSLLAGGLRIRADELDRARERWLRLHRGAAAEDLELASDALIGAAELLRAAAKDLERGPAPDATGAES